MPCDTCRQDFIQWYKNHGDPFEGQAFEWSVDLHNYVNRKLAKKTMTLEESRDLWTSDLCSYSCTDRAGAATAQASAAATAAAAATFDTKTSLLLVLLAIAVLVAVWSIRKK